jgi:uncharacterized DUF497 family protein
MNDEVYVYLEQVFEWDRMKAARNVIKHHVRFTEAATVFFDESALFERDPDHSEDENHFVVLGWSVRRDVLMVVHVLRGDRIRLISARTATPSERRRYDQQRRRF